MATRESRIAAADAALATIDGKTRGKPISAATASAIALTVADLNNKDANVAIRRWMASPQGPRWWRTATKEIWIARQRLRERPDTKQRPTAHG